MKIQMYVLNVYMDVKHVVVQVLVRVVKVITYGRLTQI